MSLPEFLTPAYLAQIVKEADKKKKYETPALNVFFKNKKYAPNGFVKVPKEVNNVDDILPLITKGAAIPQSDLDVSRQYTTYELKYYGDLKVLTTYDVEQLLQQIQHLTGDTYASKRAEIANSILEDFNNKVNATREFMACSALSGSIKDKDGNVIDTFNIPNANKLGKKSLAKNKMFLLLAELDDAMAKATKYKGKTAVILGKEAYKTIRESEQYDKWVDKQIAQITEAEKEQGILGFLGDKNRPFLVLDDVYYDKAGNRKPFFKPNSMLSVPMGIFTEFYGSIATNAGNFATMKHIDTFMQNNPDGTAFRLQCSGTPIITLPNAIVEMELEA